MSAIPNLFIIGAMKSGTTSICRYLSEHPSVYVSNPKEPMHFSRVENYGQGNAKYLELFKGVTSEKWIAEGSTEYSKRPFREGVAERIHEFNPDARLVFLMRDPVDRIASQYRHMVNTGREHETLTIALTKKRDYLSNSHYAYQLRPYVERFGRDAIHVDTLEHLQKNPRDVCSRLFSFLEIESRFVPSSLGTIFNESPSSFGVSPATTSRTLLRRVGMPLKHLIPREGRKWINKHFFEGEIQLRRTEFDAQVERLRSDLAPLVVDWVAELEAMIGQSFCDWRTVKLGQSGELPLSRHSGYYYNAADDTK